jgi:hypothetical protein
LGNKNETNWKKTFLCFAHVSHWQGDQKCFIKETQAFLKITQYVPIPRNVVKKNFGVTDFVFLEDLIMCIQNVYVCLYIFR